MLQTASTYRYNSKVYIAPPWDEIYANDEERKQSLSEAIDTYRVMEMVYSDLGYEVVEISKTSVIERTNFIVEWAVL